MREESHYRNVPKSVRVGCYLFRIEVAEFEDHEAEGSFGHMNPISQKIRLRPGMTAQNLANTFIHEVLHAIYFYLRPNDEEGEEAYVTNGANGLCAFWQDNPEAVKWWVNLLKLEIK